MQEEQELTPFEVLQKSVLAVGEKAKTSRERVRAIEASAAGQAYLAAVPKDGSPDVLRGTAGAFYSINVVDLIKAQLAQDLGVGEDADPRLVEWAYLGATGHLTSQGVFERQQRSKNPGVAATIDAMERNLGRPFAAQLQEAGLRQATGIWQGLPDDEKAELPLEDLIRLASTVAAGAHERATQRDTGRGLYDIH